MSDIGTEPAESPTLYVSSEAPQLNLVQQSTVPPLIIPMHVVNAMCAEDTQVRLGGYRALRALVDERIREMTPDRPSVEDRLRTLEQYVEARSAAKMTYPAGTIR